jgi:diaminopimelate epimerase
MKFEKYQALGNDYLVIEPQGGDDSLEPDLVRWLCNRHYGAGSDGIVLGPLPARFLSTGSPIFHLRFYNPDGREFEKSGNGVRIFARYLWDHELVGSDPFCVRTLRGDVICRVHTGGHLISAEMGQVLFNSQNIPVSGPTREVLNEKLTLDGIDFLISAASIGNPHCVVLCDHFSKAEVLHWGPLIENHPMFSQQTNVQFLEVIDRGRIQIQIWERGAGYTLASGTSSIAAAAVAHRLGLCEPEIFVQMPGGILKVALSHDYHAVLEGPVVRVYQGEAFLEGLAAYFDHKS